MPLQHEQVTRGNLKFIQSVFTTYRNTAPKSSWDRTYNYWIDGT
jgi:hypothetical protein